jgi:hypothetical protein
MFSIVTTHEYTQNGDTLEVELRIFYTWIPGQPQQGPTYASGGEPAEPAELEFHHVEQLITAAPGHGTTWVRTSEFDDWAESYLLGGDGYDKACEQAQEDSQPDPDDARDRAADREMMDRE